MNQEKEDPPNKEWIGTTLQMVILVTYDIGAKKKHPENLLLPTSRHQHNGRPPYKANEKRHTIRAENTIRPERALAGTYKTLLAVSICT